MLATSLSEHRSGVGPLLLPTLVDAALKGTGILLVTALTARLLRRVPAAGRHLVWFLGALSLLLLPILSAALPGWYVLPRWAGQDAQPVRQTPTELIN